MYGPAMDPLWVQEGAARRQVCTGVRQSNNGSLPMSSPAEWSKKQELTSDRCATDPRYRKRKSEVAKDEEEKRQPNRQKRHKEKKKKAKKRKKNKKDKKRNQEKKKAKKEKHSSSTSSSSVSTTTLHSLLERARGKRAERPQQSAVAANEAQQSSFLSFLPPVSTGHCAGRKLNSNYRGFATHIYSDKDEMGRLLGPDGRQPQLSKLHKIDRELHAKGEKKAK